MMRLLYLIHNSGLVVCIIFVILAFSVRGKPCANDLNDSICTGEEAGQVTFRRWRTPDDDLAHFLLRVLQVVVIDGMLIVENGRGFGEGNTILGFVARGFVFVPFELEGFLFFHKGEYSMCSIQKWNFWIPQVLLAKPPVYGNFQPR